MDHRTLGVVAGRQLGLFTAAQARSAGLGRSTIRRWSQEGRVAVLHPGVYAFRVAPRSWEQRLLAATLAAGPDAVASHRSAARIWRLLDPDDDVVEVTVPAGGGRRRRGFIVHRSADLAPAHCTVWRRQPVTNPLRTMVDLGAVAPAPVVEDALDEGLARRLFSVAGVEWVRSEVARQGRRGAGVIGDILDRRALGQAVPDGLLEPRMVRLLRSAGLPAPAFQHVVRTTDGRFLARVDFAYPEIRLAIEVDGYACHGSPRAMSKDFVRQNGLVPHGWRVLRFTWDQVVRTPEAVACTIAESLAALPGPSIA